MTESAQYEEWRETIKPFLVSKLEEFHLLGVKSMTLDELWVFLIEIIEKKNKKEPRLSFNQFVNNIMGVSVNDYMNKIRMEMFSTTTFPAEWLNEKKLEDV